MDLEKTSNNIKNLTTKKYLKIKIKKYLKINGQKKILSFFTFEK